MVGKRCVHKSKRINTPTQISLTSADKHLPLPLLELPPLPVILGLALAPLIFDWGLWTGERGIVKEGWVLSPVPASVYLLLPAGLLREWEREGENPWCRKEKCLQCKQSSEISPSCLSALSTTDPCAVYGIKENGANAWRKTIIYLQSIVTYIYTLKRENAKLVILSPDLGEWMCKRMQSFCLRRLVFEQEDSMKTGERAGWQEWYETNLQALGFTTNYWTYFPTSTASNVKEGGNAQFSKEINQAIK